MGRNIKIFKFCFRQMINIKAVLALLAALFLHLAFYQSGVISYIFHFECLIPFIFSIMFLDVLNVSVKNGMIDYENKVQFSKFKLYYYRYLSCFITAVVFAIVAHVEYAILFFDKINIHEVIKMAEVEYSNITVLKVSAAFLISLLILSKLLVFLNTWIKNKYIALALLIFFVLASIVYRSLPLNFLSLYFYGTEWLPGKIIWLGICVLLDLIIYLKYKFTGFVVSN